MAEKLNICIISREFPPDTAFGGIATFSLDVAKILQAKGHSVTVFSQSTSISQRLDYQGIRVEKIRILFGNYRNLPAFILSFNFQVMKAVMQQHRETPFDIIDVPDHLAEGLFATLFSNIPVVTRLHTPYALLVAMGLNDYKKGISYRLIKLAEKIALRRSNALYAPCPDLVHRCDVLFSIGKVPVRYFGYPLDLNLFSPLESRQASFTGIPEQSKHSASIQLLFLGRLEQRKGIETIAEAFPLLYKEIPEITLTLVGNDTPNIKEYRSAREYLKAIFEKSQCLDAVRFVDSVPLEQLPALFGTHQIVWVPSMYDNYPLICLEAMACRKAVVVSDAGGLPFMVDNEETGLVFKAGDFADLTRQTHRLCVDPELRQRLAQNAMDFAQKACSTETIYQETIKLYKTAMAS